MLLNVRNPRKKTDLELSMLQCLVRFPRREGGWIDRVESRQFFNHIKLFDIAFYVMGKYAFNTLRTNQTLVLRMLERQIVQCNITNNSD